MLVDPATVHESQILTLLGQLGIHDRPVHLRPNNKGEAPHRKHDKKGKPIPPGLFEFFFLFAHSSFNSPVIGSKTSSGAGPKAIAV